MLDFVLTLANILKGMNGSDAYRSLLTSSIVIKYYWPSSPHGRLCHQYVRPTSSSQRANAARHISGKCGASPTHHPPYPPRPHPYKRYTTSTYSIEKPRRKASIRRHERHDTGASCYAPAARPNMDTAPLSTRHRGSTGD